MFESGLCRGGSNITEAFKATLPTGWVKTRFDLELDAIKKASAEEREEFGLVCQPSVDWKISSK